MKINKQVLKRLIQEELQDILQEIQGVARPIDDIAAQAGLTEEEMIHLETNLPAYISGKMDIMDDLSFEIFEKLYEYFAFESREMPHGFASADSGDPAEWILYRLSPAEYIRVRKKPPEGLEDEPSL